MKPKVKIADDVIRMTHEGINYEFETMSSLVNFCRNNGIEVLIEDVEVV
ncbi:MAG: hypothetical protein IJR13_07720 [Bacteroidales bacterium]|nr:hypothetical protein [Bacteroidales bacterium]